MGLAGIASDGFLRGSYLMGESRATYEQLLESLGPSDLFASLSSLKDE